MRFDRELTLRFIGPIARWLTGTAESCVPVLMYHSISDESEPGVAPYYRLVTSPQRFSEHLDLLRSMGYSGVSLEEAMEMTESERRERRPVALTFDDGFSDFYSNAWPRLTEAGFTASMYLPTAFVGNSRRSFRGKPCLTWDEVREMRRSGVRFGSHTVNHGKLYDLSWHDIARETLYSKRDIERELKEEITSFAYPYAFPQEDPDFVEHLSDVLRRQGYRSCATTLIGRHRSSEGLFVARLPANAADDCEFLSAKLRGQYDWMAFSQRVVRHLRRRQRFR